jgi:3-hydroxyisobutyrate dehydrogenase
MTEAENTVAVLGAGSTMGLPIARNIARAGIGVRAWNRTKAKAEPLADDGAQVFDTPAEAAAGADVILTMLADADAVLATVEAALKGASPETIWLQMSTIGERGTKRCVELAREHEIAFLDAPVLGTRQPAEEGKLIVMASGPGELRDRVQPIFDAIGSKTLWIDDEPGAGTRLKMATNSWVLTVTEGCAETIALAQGLELDPSLLFEAFEGTALDLPYFRMKGKAILERKFDPMFRLKLAAKDASLIEQSATDHGLDLPLFGVIHERMAKAAEEHGDKDMCATWFASAPKSLSV